MCKIALENIVGQDENAGINHHFLLFPICSFHFDSNSKVKVKSNLSSATAFHLEQSTIFSSDNGLIISDFFFFCDSLFSDDETESPDQTILDSASEMSLSDGNHFSSTQSQPEFNEMLTNTPLENMVGIG